MARVTEFGQYRFVVKDHRGDGFCLALEADGDPLPVLARVLEQP